MRSRIAWIALAAALATVAGCGGGGGGGDADETAVPDSAVESSQSFFEFVGDRRSSESKDPLAMNGTMPPTSETAEPIDID